MGHTLSDPGWFMVVLFVCYLAFTVFAVLNVVTGVFCQSALESAALDQDLMVQAQLAEKERYVSKAQQLFKDIDGEEQGILTYAEFENRLKDESVRTYFSLLELDISDAWTLFKLIDINDAYEVSIEDFVTGCLRLKGSAKSIDIATIMYQNQKIITRLNDMMNPYSGFKPPPMPALSPSILAQTCDDVEELDSALRLAGTESESEVSA